MLKRSYGLIPDKEDRRDFLSASPRASTPLPVAADWRNLCSPVRDQGNLGSCTGFAIVTGLREFMLRKAQKRQTQLSPLFLYYEERVLENSIEEDAGAEIRDGLKVLAKLGVCTESSDRYSPRAFTQAPEIRALLNAKRYTISAYHRVDGLLSIRAALAAGNGIVMGFTVFESFEGDAVAQTGYMSMPVPNEEILGGHAVFVCGYRNDPKAPGGGWLIIKNSWGTDWGDQGYCYMPYAYVATDQVCDCWLAIA